VPQIAELALRIGSDCPFFLDAGCQLAGGRGERLTAIERRADFHLVIAVPDFPSPTGAAYSALNRSTTPITPLVTPQLARALEAGDLQLATASMVNDFEPLLLKRQPHYRDWLETLLHSGAAAASITGSGSGFFGLLTSEDEALIAAEELSSRGGFRYCGAHRPVG